MYDIEHFDWWLNDQVEAINNELEDIHPARWAKSGHVQNLLQELDQAVTTLRLLHIFRRSKEVLQEAHDHGVSGS